MASDMTDKQKAFVAAYLSNGFNGTRAAQAAGYKGDDNTLAAIASENLRKPKIRQAIDSQMNQLGMSVHEVLGRLSEHARGDMRDFMGLGTDSLKAHPRAWLIKKYKRKVTTIGSGDAAIQLEQIEIELHDPQAALVQLGRYHKLFVDRVRIDDWRTEAIDLIRRKEVTFEAVAKEFGDEVALELYESAGVPVGNEGKAGKSG